MIPAIFTEWPIGLSRQVHAVPPPTSHLQPQICRLHPGRRPVRNHGRPQGRRMAILPSATPEVAMAIEKKPAKNTKKAPAKSLKEKRADKAAKRASK